MRAVPLIIVAGILVSTGCKRRPSYDQRSPEATLRSFQKAVNDGHIPRDLRQFISNPHELELWRLRCEAHGCRHAQFTVAEIGPVADDRAVLFTAYKVMGRDRDIAVQARRSPIYFELAGDRWLIRQFGDQIAPPPRAPRDPPAAPPDAQRPDDPPPTDVRSLP